MKAAIAKLSVAIYLAGTFASAQEVTLKPAMIPGREVAFDREMTTKESLKMDGMDRTTVTVVTQSRLMKVGEKSPAGGATIEFSTHKLRFSLNDPKGVSFSFSSDAPDQIKVDDVLAQEFIDALKLKTKLRTKIEFDGSGRIATVKLEGEGVENLPEHYKLLSNEKGLKASLEKDFDRYPDKPVQPGDTWERSDAVEAAFGRITYRMTYKYEGRKNKDGKSLDKVTATRDKAEYSIAADSGIGLQLKSSDLKIGDSKLVYWFDPERKLIVIFDSTVKITGKIEFTENGEDLPAELDLTMTGKTIVKSVKDRE